MATNSNHDRVALSFLPVKGDFSYSIYRTELNESDQSVPGTRWLPRDLSKKEESGDKRSRYAVSLSFVDGYDEVKIGAWVDVGLTADVLHQALVKQCKSDALASNVEVPSDDFHRKIAFTLATHGTAREVMWLRAYGLKSTGQFGFLTEFSLRVPAEEQLPDRRRLELSLSQKNGRPNEDFYLDHYQKLEQFLNRYLPSIENLPLHDGTTVTIDSKISLVPSFQLSKRTYKFAGDKEANNQFFGLRDNPPLKLADQRTRLEFVFLPADRSKSQDLFRALRGSTYTTFSGMEKMFRTPIGNHNVSATETLGFTNSELSQTAIAIKTKYAGTPVVPIVVVPFTKHVSEEETRKYFAAKHAFLQQGLYSQFVDRKRLEDRNALKWSVSNIGLALFAKMGGVPWRIKPSTENCLLVGIGQAHRIVDGKIERYFAYSVLADSSGIYESIRILGSSTDRTQYFTSLKDKLREVLLEHKGKYKSFVLHLTFSMKKDELKAISDLLKELQSSENNQSEFVALKFNDHNDFFGFSIKNNSRVPFEGTVAELSRKDFLVWFSGLSLDDSKAPKKPERPVHIRVVYPERPLDRSDLKRLLQDSMNIAGANWRGFNAKSMPISIYYAKLIADYYSHFREAGLTEIDIESLSPWFL
jgi:Piwi domain